MFTDHNRPFYKSAVMMLLEKPPIEESIEFVTSRFKSCGVSMSGEIAGKIVGMAENIPYYIQQIGFEVFRIVDDDKRKTVAEKDVFEAYKILAGFNRDQYEQLMLSFSTAQKKLLIALAKERIGEFDEGYRNRHGLGAPSTLNSAKRKLIEDGHIEQMNGLYYVSDPFFAEYMRF